MFWLRIKNKKGFTLLEIIIVLGIFVLLLTGIGYLMSGTMRTFRITFNQLTAQKEGRQAIAGLIKEARRAAASSIGAYPIEQATTNSFIFYSDIDNDTFRERVRYFLENKQFKKAVIKPSGAPLNYNPANETIIVLVKDVTSVQVFSYYDKNYQGSGSALSFPVNVTEARLIKINLTIEQDPNISPQPITVSGQVQIRNLKE